MEWRSWLGRKSKGIQNPNHQKKSKQQSLSQRDPAEEEELLGVTPQLIDQVKTFTLATFKNFPLREEEEEGSSAGGGYNEETSSEAKSFKGNVREDLSDWQQRHAVIVLSKVKELSQLRFKLCPGYLKERQFWRIYFTLVKNHLAEYELRAIQLDRLKRMAEENEQRSANGATEVEMAETKKAVDAHKNPTCDLPKHKYHEQAHSRSFH